MKVDSWLYQPAIDSFDQISTTDKKVKTKECKPAGKFPVVDQGQELIAGYIDDESKLINTHKPTVIFGDHTRAIKWISFPFVPGADGTKLLSPKPIVEPRFSYYQLLSLDIPDKGYARHFKYLKELDVPLPPLAEQKVIAGKLDSLLAQVETTKARLERIPEILKTFRQSVLAAAVSGKLTEEWRKSGYDDDFLVSELPENNRTRRGLPERVAIPDVLKKFSFPDGWSVLSVASLLRKGVIKDLKDGNHGANHPKSSEFEQEGLPFITAAQMSDDGNIDYIGAPKLSGVPLDKLKVGFSEPDDVIYSHKGTVGRVSIADRKSVLSPQTTYIRLNQKYVSNQYYAFMLKSHAFTLQVDAIKSQTTRDFVPITAHYSLFAVIPPFNEQVEIVRIIKQLFDYADKIELQANAALQRVNNLTQSILAKAFRGELTAKWREQNPELISGENSAEALLAKIKAEREKLKPAKKVRKRASKV